MTSERKDPREAVLDDWGARLERYLGGDGDQPPSPTEAIARFDAADPLRAMLGEVVEGLEYALPSLENDTDRLLESDYYGAGIKALAKLDDFRDLLARLRTATEGGQDDARR
jgi:hypothetical protein